MLEHYLLEIIAFILLSTLIILYFFMRLSQQKRKNEEPLSPPKAQKPPKKQSPKEQQIPIAQELKTSVDEIATESLSGTEEGSFGIDTLQEDQTAQNSLRAKKREVPPHAKITKANFQEFSGLRILVAEDNLINQKVISGLLADTGIDLVMANDGKEALDILEKDNNFSFILMDAHMPRIDGFEATKAIRANPRYEHILVVALSGDTAADDIKKMQNAGMQEHLEKPLRIDALYDILYAYTGPDMQEDGQEYVKVIMTQELNGDKGLNICGGDEAFYREILHEFVQNYSDSAQTINIYLQNKQLAQADQLLLDIIGITANIGADTLNSFAKDLKDALGDTQEKSYVSLVDQYEKHLNSLLKDIKSYLV